jgi:flavin reductase (DIM6/NTAB) family NADH-FMN oxidoreductase RutF
MFAANKNLTTLPKDSVANAEAAGCFGWSLATWDLREYVNATAEYVPPEVDEFERAGLEKSWSRVLPHKIPLVKRSPVHFECVYHSTTRLPGNSPLGTVDVVIGRVVAIHIEDWALTDGKIDIAKTQPIARCGYYEYVVLRPENVFEMIIPGMNETVLAGLEGSVKRSRAALGGVVKKDDEPESSSAGPGPPVIPKEIPRTTSATAIVSGSAVEETQASVPIA